MTDTNTHTSTCTVNGRPAIIRTWAPGHGEQTAELEATGVVTLLKGEWHELPVSEG